MLFNGRQMMKDRRGIALFGACLALVLALWAGPTSAQKPTPEQIDALRANCKADLAKLCPGVPPGGQALLCLRKNVDRASPACQRAVRAVK
jgi:Cysteine rich repeat